MTHDDRYLILSDGSSKIYFRDPGTLDSVKTINVTDNQGLVNNVNELEYIKGYIYANQWQTNYILKIDTSSGKVVGKLDLGSIVGEESNKYPGSEVLNGIAYDSASGKIYITGKLWPNIFEIKFPL